METYLEIIDARSGNACVTGLGAMFKSIKATREAFDNARQLEKANGPFLLDLYVKGDLVDTIRIDADGVEAISGTTPESPEYYVEYDKKFWEAMREPEAKSKSQ